MKFLSPLFKTLVFLFFISSSFKASAIPAGKGEEQWAGRIYPPERRIVTDSVSGAKIIYATTHPGKDINFYFDWNCWFNDQSCMFFTSDRNGRNELFGYVPKTGELICFSPEHQVKSYWFGVVDYRSHDIYMTGNNAVIGWHVDIRFNRDSSKVEQVMVRERIVAKAPEGEIISSALTQSADCQELAMAVAPQGHPFDKTIMSVNIASGRYKSLFQMHDSIPLTHIQYSKYNNYLLRFAHDGPKLPGVHRLWILDTRKPGKAIKIHLQERGELVTHEDWWLNDQLTFCGGYRPDESHVKIINIHDQQTRIIGPGAWWEGGTPSELAKYNWWHASGARDGRWVACDNWHGTIGIIDMRTAKINILTQHHRTYGKGEHPHVGWAPDSKSVEFTTNRYGNPDIVIAYLPLEKWGYPFEEH